MKMYPIEVLITSDGLIDIIQENGIDEESVVRITVDQVDTLIAFLQRAVHEAT